MTSYHIWSLFYWRWRWICFCWAIWYLPRTSRSDRCFWIIISAFICITTIQMPDQTIR